VEMFRLIWSERLNHSASPFLRCYIEAAQLSPARSHRIIGLPLNAISTNLQIDPSGLACGPLIPSRT
jgi:hypothetical protein